MSKIWQNEKLNPNNKHKKENVTTNERLQIILSYKTQSSRKDDIFLYCLDKQFLKNLYIFLSFINNTLHERKK